MASAEALPQAETLLQALDITAPLVSLEEIELATPEADPHPAQTFHLFPCLPKELRDIIWTFALPGPQIIELEVEHGKGARQINFHFPGNPHWKPLVALHGQFNDAKTDLKLPGMVYACRESRVIGLEAYGQCFVYTPIQTSRYEELLGAKEIPLAEIAMPGITFQPKKDTIYIRGDMPNSVADMLEESVAQELSPGNIKSLALDSDLFERGTLVHRCFRASPEYVGDVLAPTGVCFTGLPWFHGIEELILVCALPVGMETPEVMKKLRDAVEETVGELLAKYRTPAERGLKKRIPSVILLRKDDFKALPRWRL